MSYWVVLNLELYRYQPGHVYVSQLGRTVRNKRTEIERDHATRYHTTMIYITRDISSV